MTGEIAESCMPVFVQFVSGSIVRVPECVRVLLRQIRCSDDLFLVQIATLFTRFARVQLFYTRQ